MYQPSFSVHCPALHCTALHCTLHITNFTLQCTAYCTLHTALHCPALQCNLRYGQSEPNILDMLRDSSDDSGTGGWSPIRSVDTTPPPPPPTTTTTTTRTPTMPALMNIILSDYMAARALQHCCSTGVEDLYGQGSISSHLSGGSVGRPGQLAAGSIGRLVRPSTD
jgi:hypothetical protein